MRKRTASVFPLHGINEWKMLFRDRNVPRRLSWIICLVVGVLASSRAAYAQGAMSMQDATTLAEGAPLKAVKTLSWFTGQYEPLTLREQSSAKSIIIPLPPDKRILRAHLHLLGLNQASFRPQGPQLLVSLNGKAVRRIVLDGAVPTIDHVVDLPPDWFRSGLNRLTVAVIQRSGQGCGHSDASRFWVKISPRSKLAFTYRAKAGPLSLARLKAFFDQDFSRADARIMILYQSSLGRLPDAIMAAAQSVALLRDGQQPVQILAEPLTSRSLTKAGRFAGNVIVLKTLRRTEPRTSKQGSSQGHATFALTHNLAGNVILTIKAAGPAALAHAARLVGIRPFAWPDAARAVIDLPRGGHVRHTDIRRHSSGTLSFHAAGLPVETATGRAAKFMPLTFWNPNWGGHAILYLHLAYSAGAGPGSLIQAFVNGDLVGSIPLASPAGGTYPDYKLLVPENAMNVGKNRLVLKTLLQVDHHAAASCGAYGNHRPPGVTIFPDSRLAIIGGSRIVPNNLAAIGAGAFPVTVVALSAPSPAVISAAATFGAKLAQAVHHAGVEMVSAIPARQVPGMVVVGTNRTLPAALLRRTGLFSEHGALETAKLSAGLHATSAAGSRQPIPAKTGKTFDKYMDASAATGSAAHHESLAAGNLAGSAIVAMSRLASDADQPLVVITAAKGAILQGGMAALVEARDWTRLSGTAAVIVPGSALLETVGAPTVPISVQARLGYLASRHPSLAILMICGIMLLAVLAIQRLIVLRHRRLYPTVKGLDER
jgi:hypothetical protein